MNPLLPDCPFCLQNALFEGRILAETDSGFITDALHNPGYYLVVPKAHVETISQLADDWWKDVEALTSYILEPVASFNISLNYGADAGQSVRHLHFWIIPRLPARLSSGKGLARLISDVDSSDASE